MFCFAVPAYSQTFEQQMLSVNENISDAETRSPRPPASPAPSAADPERAEFRALLNELARLSSGSPLRFREFVLKEPAPRDVSFTLTIDEKPGYKDAFMLRFTGPSRNFSTLVAYEGANGFVMGRLKVARSGGGAVYKHVFEGFFDDVITMTVENGKIAAFAYEKVNPQGVIFDRLLYKAS